MFVNRSSIEPIVFEGLEIFDYTADYELDSSMAMISVPAGTAHAEAYSKRSNKYYLVVGGTVTFRVEGEEKILSDGDFCFVKRGNRFSYENTGGIEARLVLVHTPSFALDQEVFV